jgi:hypothetical protein
MNKKDLSERDICSKYITPAVQQAGWDPMSQIREEVGFTKGRIIVRGKLVTRGKAKRADYILYYKPNIPIALIEAKDNNHAVADGIQQALEYAATLDIPFVFSSNGDGFVFHDKTGLSSMANTTNSKDTRVQPVFKWLSDNDEPTWPVQLVQIAKGITHRPGCNAIRHVFLDPEKTVPATLARMAWKLKNADGLTPQGYKAPLTGLLYASCPLAR